MVRTRSCSRSFFARLTSFAICFVSVPEDSALFQGGHVSACRFSGNHFMMMHHHGNSFSSSSPNSLALGRKVRPLGPPGSIRSRRSRTPHPCVLIYQDSSPREASPARRFNTCTPPCRCRANLAQICQSRPDSGLGLSHFRSESLEHHLSYSLPARQRC